MARLDENGPDALVHARDVNDVASIRSIDATLARQMACPGLLGVYTTGAVKKPRHASRALLRQRPGSPRFDDLLAALMVNTS